MVILILIHLISINKIEKFTNKKELFFIHIPKNAGTSIEDCFKKKNINIGKFYFNKKKKFKLSIKNNKNNPWNLWHIPPKYFLDNSYKNKILFAIVRNPYDRIISECKYRGGKCNDINKFIIENLKAYKKNKFILDSHLIPQSEFIKGNVECKEIIRFENLNKDFEKLLKKYNYPKMDLPHNNKSNIKKKISINILNKKTINLINEIYEEDFKNFGYKLIDVYNKITF